LLMMGMYQKNKRSCLLWLFVCMCSLANAQLKNYKYQADVQKIDSGGVYRIELSPGLIAKSYDGSSDIRIVDDKGKSVAFVLSSKLSLNSPDSFIVFPEVTPEQVTDTAIFYTAENKNNLDISQLWLRLKKTDVSRTVNLIGSDDLKNWFAIKEDIPLEQADAGRGTDYQQSLTFPTSNYRYFRVQIISRGKVPVKILQAGIYTVSLNKPVFAELPAVGVSSTDVNKTSRVIIDLHQPYRVHKLYFNISSPKYFNRRVVIYAMNGNGNDIASNDILADTILTSSGTQDISLSVKTKKLRVDIYNGDDNPLVIKSVRAYQVKLYAVCYLESGHKYSIYTGNPSATAADYDLSFLNNRAYNQLPGISEGDVHNNGAYAILPVPNKSDHSIILWTSLILVLMILSFLTLKMVREIK
jgi:hypothetical protein